VSFSTGLELDSGYASTMFANSKGDACELIDPRVLLCWKPVVDFSHIKPFVEDANETGESLVIVAPDFSDEVVTICATNAAKKVVQMCLVYTPGNQKTDKEDLTLDLAAILGAEVFGETKTAEEWKSATDMGRCDQVIVRRNRTIIAGAKHDDDKFEIYLASLRDKITKDDPLETLSEFEIEKIKQRLAHLSGGVATIHVGALTTQELQEKKDRYEDAVCAVRTAVKDGIVPGAGVPLLKLSAKIVEIATLMNDKSPLWLIAVKAYALSLRSIAEKLADSCGADPITFLRELFSMECREASFDARTGNVIKDAFETGIVDPLNVVELSVLYATNVALTFLQIGFGLTNDAPNLTYERLDPLVEEE
jgi:chaperonin GroEL